VFNSDFDLVAPRQNSKLLIRRQLSQAICGFETTSITHFEIGRENFNDNTFKTYWSAQLQLEVLKVGQCRKTSKVALSLIYDDILKSLI